VPLLIRRADLLAEGTSDNDIRRARRIGTLTALAPGSYLPPGEAQHLNRSDRHRLALEAVLPRLSGNPVVSHVSAALLHELPVPLGQERPVHVTRTGPTKSRRGRGVISHRAVLHPDDVTDLGGLTVTSVARTVLDCAFVLRFDAAVELAEAALRHGRVGADELASQLARHARAPGVRAAAAMLDRVTG